MIEKNPLISIIIPCYNRGNLIDKTLDSIKNQVYTNWECIIVDDESTDNTFDIITSYSAKDPRFKVFKRPSDSKKGANTCRNLGFEYSKGDYINWFDSDDIMLEDFILEKVNHLTEKSSISICGYTNVKSDLSYLDNVHLSDTLHLQRDYVLWKLPLITNCVLFKRDFLENKSLFNLNLSRGQEFELFIRLFHNVVPEQVSIVHKPLFKYVKHDNSISSSLSREKSHQYLSSRLYCNRLLVSYFQNDQEVILKAYHQGFKDLYHCRFYNNHQIFAEYIEFFDQEILQRLKHFKYRLPVAIIKLNVVKSLYFAVLFKKLLTE